MTFFLEDPHSHIGTKVCNCTKDKCLSLESYHRRPPEVSSTHHCQIPRQCTHALTAIPFALALAAAAALGTVLQATSTIAAISLSCTNSVPEPLHPSEPSRLVSWRHHLIGCLFFVIQKDDIGFAICLKQFTAIPCPTWTHHSVNNANQEWQCQKSKTVHGPQLWHNFFSSISQQLNPDLGFTSAVRIQMC